MNAPSPSSAPGAPAAISVATSVAISVAGALAQALAGGLERLDAHLLLGHVLGRNRTWLISHDDAPLEAQALARFQALWQRRAAGEPAAYLLGEREFHGLTLAVSPAVLVPRPDTETLVDWGLALLQGPQAPLADLPAPRVIDLGTGSGAIALALKHALPQAQLTATDQSAAALTVAQRNGQALGLEIRWCQGDWWQAVAGERFELALSNPPYIAGDDPHLAALRHEPLAALTPGGDGLSAIAALVGGAGQHLEQDGWLLIEHGWDQAEAVSQRLKAAGFVDIATQLDLAGHTRCTGGRWPHSPAAKPASS